jgi:hypothetical protein
LTCSVTLGVKYVECGVVTWASRPKVEQDVEVK